MPSSHSCPCRVQGFPPPSKVKYKKYYQEKRHRWMKAKDKPDHWKQYHYYDRNKLNSVGKNQLRTERTKNYTLPIRALIASTTIQASWYKLPLLTEGLNSSLKLKILLFCPSLVQYVGIKTSLVTNKTLERSPVSAQCNCYVNPVVHSLFLNN